MANTPDFNEFRKTRAQLEKYCKENNIKKIGREYYFVIDDINYMVSPYAIIIRDCKHKQVTDYKIDERQHKYVYIRSVQANLPRIYEDLKKGIKLDEYGERI